MNKLRLTQKVLTNSSILVAACALPLFQISAISAQAFYGPPSTSPISEPISAPEQSPSPEPSTGPVSGPVTTPEPTPTPTEGPSNGGNSGSDSHSDNGGNGGSSAPSCNAEKPKAPYLVSWEKVGPNQVKLHWSKPQGSVNYYSIAYGLKPNTPLYGNPYVGGGNTTETVINGLSGQQTYYFVVAAGNDCVHSDKSNEVVVKINGAKLNTPVQGFSQKNVLSAVLDSKTAPKASQAPVNQPVQNTQTQSTAPGSQQTPQTNFFSSIGNFFGNFFRH